MEAQGNLNEEALDDGQAAQILADFNDIDIASTNKSYRWLRERLHDGQKQSVWW